MQQIYERVAGLDVHRDNVVACFRRLGARGGVVFEKDRFATTTKGLRELEAWLTERQVELVAMEATGVYWKPVLYALEVEVHGVAVQGHLNAVANFEFECSIARSAGRDRT